LLVVSRWSAGVVSRGGHGVAVGWPWLGWPCVGHGWVGGHGWWWAGWWDGVVGMVVGGLQVVNRVPRWSAW
jgi:hypothetical protein